MRFVEETGGSWTEQLRFAEAEIEQQKREWEANRLADLRKEEEDAKRAEEEENQLLTYSGVDARNQVNNKSKKTVNRSLGRNKSSRPSEIVKVNRRSRNLTPRSPQSKRRTLPAANSPKKRKIEEPQKRRTTSRSIPKRLCRQTNNSRSETTDNDNDVSSDGGNASSNESKKGTSDSVVDSECSLDECSLDVMYDEQQSESNSAQAGSMSGVENDKIESSDHDDSSDNEGNASENEEKGSDDEENGSDDEKNGSDDGEDASDSEENVAEQNGKENVAKPVSADKRRESLTNRLDINSPRTRSRGTVKLNLWALDDSPILPSFGGRSKRNQVKSQPNDSNDKSTSEPLSRSKNNQSRSTSPSDLSRKFNENDKSLLRAKRSRSKSQPNERDPAMKFTCSPSHSSSNDVDEIATDSTNNHLTENNESIGRMKRNHSNSEDECPNQSNDVGRIADARDHQNTITVMKLAQIKDGLDGSKPLKAKRPPKKVVVKNGKSSSTLDSWLSSSKSAKIVLNKDDDAIAKHMTQIAARTRRSSTLKINAENGPS